jgi:hypothetical protein
MRCNVTLPPATTAQQLYTELNHAGFLRAWEQRGRHAGSPSSTSSATFTAAMQPVHGGRLR